MSKYPKLAALFQNSELIDKKEKFITLDEALGDDCEYVAIYFSAHWCPPCRRFTPILSEYFTKSGTKNKLKIIFATSDSSEETFLDYLSSMSWNLAFPFESSPIRALSKKYGVTGIPTLVLLDKEGNLITKDFREMVMKDPEGKQFSPVKSGTSTSSSSTSSSSSSSSSSESIGAVKNTPNNNTSNKKNETSSTVKIMDFISAIGIFIISTAVVRYFYPQDKFIGITIGAAIAAGLLGGHFK